MINRVLSLHGRIRPIDAGGASRKAARGRRHRSQLAHGHDPGRDGEIIGRMNARSNLRSRHRVLHRPSSTP